MRRSARNCGHSCTLRPSPIRHANFRFGERRLLPKSWSKVGSQASLLAERLFAELLAGWNKMEKGERLRREGRPNMSKVEIGFQPIEATHITLPTRESITGLTTVLFISFFVCLAIYQQNPPEAQPMNIPLEDFSSGRAMKHLAVIAKKPRPIGSSEHAEVRNYILKELVAMGLSPEVQKATAVSKQRPALPLAGTVHNVIARLEGKAATKAILLVGHYDSVPTSFGAADDGSAVAVLLETLRALKAGAPLEQDVIFLFTDGEEIALLGATVFVEEHPWIRDVGLVLNFEARGNGGPALMFETSDENAWLIKQFAKAAPYPIANSLSYEIYKLLPNDTDMTIFKKSGVAGLNFAYVSGVTHYHTLLDSLETLDERSLQHQGSYALALTRSFGNLDFKETSEGNDVYFNTLGPVFIHYSFAWVIPFTASVVLLFIGMMVFGFRRRQLTLSGVGLGFLALLLAMISSAAAVSFVWWVVRSLHREYRSIPFGEPYNSHLYMLSFVALTIAITSLIYFGLWRKQKSVQNLTAGALLWWVILAMATSIYLPGGSYLFLWPLLGSIIGLGFILASKDSIFASFKLFVVLCIFALPGIVLFSTTIYQLFIALGLALPGILMIMVVLPLGSLIPHLGLIAKANRWILPSAAALLSISLIVGASLASGFDENHPKADHVFYALNADSGDAIWASSDAMPDEWTSQFFITAERSALPEYFPLSARKFLTNQAPGVYLAPPEIRLLGDSVNDGVRTLRMRIASPRGAPVVSISTGSGTEVIGAVINGKQIEQIRASARMEQPTLWRADYHGLPQEGIELTLQVKASGPIAITVVDQSYGLPHITNMSFKARPHYIVPAPSSYSDSTLVRKSFNFY